MSALDELHDAIKHTDAAAATRALDADPGLATARTARGHTPAELARKTGHAALADGLDAAARGRRS